MKIDKDIQERVFKITMVWKTLYGIIKIILGTILLNLINTPLSDIFYKIMSAELTEDPNDRLFQFINSLLESYPFYVTYFLAFYLIFWGIIDAGLSISLIKHKLWAFPVSLYLIGLFIIYAIYRFFHTHSLILLWIILIDIFIFWLIGKEYRIVKKNDTTC